MYGCVYACVHAYSNRPPCIQVFACRVTIYTHFREHNLTPRTLSHSEIIPRTRSHSENTFSLLEHVLPLRKCSPYENMIALREHVLIPRTFREHVFTPRTCSPSQNMFSLREYAYHMSVCKCVYVYLCRCVRVSVIVCVRVCV